MAEESGTTTLLAQEDGGSQGVLTDFLARSVANMNTQQRLSTMERIRAGSSVELNLVKTEPNRFGQIVEAYKEAEGTAFALFKINPSETVGLIVISGDLLHGLLDLYLGDNSSSTPYSPRALTQVDLKVVRWTCEKLLGGLKETLPPDSAVEFVVESVVGLEDFGMPLPTGAAMVAGEISLGVPGKEFGSLRVVLPAGVGSVFWAARQDDEQQKETQGNEQDMVIPVQNLQRVYPVPVTLIAELHRFKVPIAQLRDLSVGSELLLGELDQIGVRVGQRLLLSAEAGERDGYRCVRINNRIDGEQTDV